MEVENTYCIVCNKELTTTDNYCSNCGVRLLKEDKEDGNAIYDLPDTDDLFINISPRCAKNINIAGVIILAIILIVLYLLMKPYRPGSVLQPLLLSYGILSLIIINIFLTYIFK